MAKAHQIHTVKHPVQSGALMLEVNKHKTYARQQLLQLLSDIPGF